MAADIGATIFMELLGMTQYPDSPFTGNIYRDLIMFLIVPTVFIIMVIYTMTGRLIADPRFRVMIGVTAYLFIIASGYYPAFALLAGPYFIFLIFILGLLYFLMGHFRSGGHVGGTFSRGGGFSGQRSQGYEQGYPVDSGKVRNLLGMPELNPGERKYLQDEIKKLDARIAAQEKIEAKIMEGSGNKGDLGRIAEIKDRLISERDAIYQKLHGRVRR